MGRHHEQMRSHTISRWALVLVGGSLLCACATPGTHKSGKLEVQDGGFTITERERFAAGVRGDFSRAVELIEQREYEQGIELLEAVVEAAPHAIAAHIDLGIALRETGQYERAVASFQKALELNPRHLVAHNELGIAYRKMGRFEDARKSYESALSVFPGFHFARRNLAVLCDLYLGDIPCAIEQYEIYAKMVPEDEKVGMWITDLRNRMAREEESTQ